MLLPPATRTRPSRTVVAEWPERGVARLGPAATLPATGLRMSVVATGAVPLEPPMIITRPSASTVIACFVRGDDMTPAALNVPASGSKISSVALATPELSPPAMSMRPSWRSAAAAPERASTMPPAMLLHVPETGSKISAELVAPPPDTVPPATRTRPSCKVAEIWLLRGLFIGAARGETDPSELKRSALATGPLPGSPPVIKTLPFCSKAAEAPGRAADMFPVACHVPLGIARTKPLSATKAPSRNPIRSTTLVNRRIFNLDGQRERVGTQQRHYPVACSNETSRTAANPR